MGRQVEMWLRCVAWKANYDTDAIENQGMFFSCVNMKYVRSRQRMKHGKRRKEKLLQTKETSVL